MIESMVPSLKLEPSFSYRLLVSQSFPDPRQLFPVAQQVRNRATTKHPIGHASEPKSTLKSELPCSFGVESAREVPPKVDCAQPQ